MPSVTVDGIIQAAGGVLWRGEGRRGNDIEVAVIHRPKYDDWSLPKGKQDPDEHLTVTARREVEEETGFRVPLGRPLLGQQYTFLREGAALTKFVRYWAMHAPATPAFPFTPNLEVDEMRWLPPGGAFSLLTHERDRATLRSLLSAPARTSTVLLLRHGKAGDKKSWKAADSERPLDQVGRAQAEAVRDVGECFAPTRVISADFTRCVQTVEPLADALGIKVELEPAISVRGYAARRRRSVRRFKELLRSGANIALCSQGEVIPGLLRALAKSADAKLEPTDIPKGGMWALSVHGRRLVAGEFFADLAPPESGQG